MPHRPVLALCAFLALTPAALAARTLERLPADKLAALPPLLRHGEISLIESESNGRMKQVTILTLVAAPADTVREVVWDASKYPEFVHNMKNARFEKAPDGSVIHKWIVSYTLTGFDGENRMWLRDGAVDVETTDPDDDGIYRWEFIPVPGGTVVAMYGYTHVTRSNNLIQSLLKRAPTLEHGLALAAQLVLLRSVKVRAEKLAGPPAGPIGDPKLKSPGFNFLLDRGRVAVIRSLPSGRLSDISVLDRVYAPRDKAEAAVARPGEWKKFIDGVDLSDELGHEGTALKFRIKFSIPNVTWDTRFLMQPDGRGGVDFLGIDGDLSGARWRWDLTQLSPKTTLAVLRKNQNMAQSSLILRALFSQEPLYEHGIAVSIAMIYMNGVRGRAEGWK